MDARTEARPSQAAQAASQAFYAKKYKIMSNIFPEEKYRPPTEMRTGVPEEEAPDASPKGSVDEPVLPLLRLINSVEDLVSTSSCSGRVSVFFEGERALDALAGEPGTGDAETVPAEAEAEAQAEGAPVAAKIGGKGYGGQWLYVSHADPLLDEATVALVRGGRSWWDVLASTEDGQVPARGAGRPRRYVHFRFEPMILHVLCRTTEAAAELLRLALACGFRESGMVNTMVGIRSSLALNAPIAVDVADSTSLARLVDDRYIETLLAMASERFRENRRRTDMLTAAVAGSRFCVAEPAVETAAERRERKRAAGLARQRAVQAARAAEEVAEADTPE
ncbi:methyltransferase TYW3-domain-containing protein [Dipodascopsis tothii]|uniref:methyltransferase TYW3-domain-containing protein n=1 Tax=Dipodascopsis tothii TaxID=44089 RepID=UPI0034CFB5F0